MSEMVNTINDMTDTDLQIKLELNTKRFKEIYDPETAFGNVELIGLIHHGHSIEQILLETKECFECRGEGTTPHKCNCEKCTYSEDDCNDCEDGRIPKS